MCVCGCVCGYVEASECERKEIYQRECLSERESMRVCVKGKGREKENMNVK